MTALRDELPHLVALCRDGSAWCLPIYERASFTDAWTAGKAFWFGEALYGERIVVKLADITGLSERTVESIAAHEAEDAERKHRAMLGDEA